MIHIDDDFKLENEYDMIIPLSFEIDRDGKCDIHCCKEVINVAEEFMNSFCDKTSREAFAWLDSKLRIFADKCGFTVYDEDTDDFYFSFKLDDPDMLDMTLIKENTVKIRENIYKNNTEYDIDSYLNDKLSVYATVINDEIVSVAAENLFDTDMEGAFEISVETLNEYRGNAFGASNVCAICKELLQRGDSVFYVTSHKNSSSIALAKKCGFILDKIFFSYCCYK
ncbi:MAG: hypothetical protein E7623_07870 [Ruminococcaceae bacterium]|nr:hypothetical protein [Oscillospiraceae bacterium]